MSLPVAALTTLTMSSSDSSAPISWIVVLRNSGTAGMASILDWLCFQKTSGAQRVGKTLGFDARAHQFDRDALIIGRIDPGGIAGVMQRDEIPIHREYRRAGRAGVGVGSIVDARAIAVEPDHGLGIHRELHRRAL